MPTLQRLHPAALILRILLAALAVSVISSAAAQDENNYRLRPMDLLKVQVFDQPTLEREVRISQDLTIALPLIGSLDVRGRSIRELERLVTALYANDYLVNPQVNIAIVEYAPRSVNVFGAVNSPTSVPIPPEKTISILDALARAGGFSRLANRTRISLTRIGAAGQPQNYQINADQLMTGNTANRWLLMDGDVIYVPERML